MSGAISRNLTAASSRTAKDLKPEATLSDPAFLDRLRSRDPETVSAVVRAYGRQLYRAARGAGLDQDSAEEVVQSTFLTLLESAGRFEGRSSARTWLFGILYNKLREHRRIQLRAEELDPIDEVIESRFDGTGSWLKPPADIEQAIAESEFRGYLEDCLKSVPPLQRSVFHLREMEEMSTEEICKILQITGTHFAVCLHRARHRLRECLESKGVRRS